MIFMRLNQYRKPVVACVMLFLMLIASNVIYALTLTSVSPSWSNAVGTSGAPTCLTQVTVGAEAQIRYGDNDFNTGCPSDPNLQSGFGFEGGSTATFTNGQPFVLGEITHYNNPIFASSLLSKADLSLNVVLGDPAYSTTMLTTVSLDETANNLTTCPYGDTSPCADRIAITGQELPFVVGGVNYQLEIVGLIPGQLASCTYDETRINTSFISDENAANSACLYGRVTQLDDAEVVIDKQASVTEARPGDIIDYQIDYNCFSTTTNCAGAVITDFLPDELVYVGSTGSTHTVATTGTYSSPNHTVRFQFIDPMPAGSTGFVRVRARVKNDGTVANGESIDNVAISRLVNGPTNTATSAIPAVAVSNWDIVKTGPATVYLDTDSPTTDTIYTVGICSAGSTVNLIGAQMVDTLPPGAVFVSASNSGTYDATAGTVTWNMGDLTASSGCTNRTVLVRYPEPPFTAGQSVINKVDGTGTVIGGAPWTDTASVTNPLQRLIPAPSVAMSKSPGRSGYVVGAQAEFLLSPQNTGNVSLDIFTVTDTLPPQVNLTGITVGQFVTSYTGTVIVRYERSDTPGVWSTWTGSPFPDDNRTLPVSALNLPAGVYINKVQWDFGTVDPGFAPIDAGGRMRLYSTVISPDHAGANVDVGSVITNTAVLDWQYIPSSGGPGIGGSSSGGASITVDAIPIPVFDKFSAGGISGSWRFLIGQQVGYYGMSVLNNTGIAVDALAITDAVPPQFNVTAVTVGGYNNFSGTTDRVTVRYQTTAAPGVWNVWPGSPFIPSNQTLNVGTLGLGSGEYITNVQWQYGTATSGFSSRGGQEPRIYGMVMTTDKNGAAVADNSTMSNNAVMSWDYEGSPSQQTDTQNDNVHLPIATPSANKSTTNSGPYIPSSAVGYSLRVGAASNSPSVLINPIVMELLPTNLNYVAGSWTYNAGSSGVAAPTFEQIANYNGTGRTLLRWRFTGNFPQNQFASINFNTTVAPGAAQGTLTNDYFVTSNDIPITGTTTDANDLDGDGQTNDQLVGGSTSIPVDVLVGLDSFKGVRGELDSSYSVYPVSGLTVPNGRVDYRLTIINRGNIPINNVKVVDILPFVGDTGVQDVRARGSAWRPVLTGAVAAPAGVVVYYSTAKNPCRPQIIASGPAGCTAPNWTLSPPADITTVYSLRFDFTNTLAPGASFNFNWTMKAPVDALDGAIAWNSFAYTSTNANTGVPLRPSEPNKVGIKMTRPVVAPLIDLVKSTNNQDANLPTGPLIPITTPVTWTYLITNSGNTRLANITVTDDKLGAITCNEGAIPTLAAGATFTCTFTGTAVINQYANVGTVSGKPVDSSGQPLTDSGGVALPNVTDTDPSHYYGFDPALARLGNYVWIDSDNDGIQDAGEDGLGGVTVNLYQSGGTSPLRTTFTDSSGVYNFLNLAPGDYFVEFVIPSTYTFTLRDQGGDDTLDSDPDRTTGRTVVTNLIAGENDPTWDAGVRPSASIGDFVWRDDNGNNIQDAGEPGFPGIQVDLLNSAGTIVATTYTDEDGVYSFTDLVPGDYAIHFNAPPGYIYSLPDIGGDDAKDSDANITTGNTTVTTLLPGENDPTWDAGLMQPASIGNFVWRDNDNNGQQDTGEPGVSGVTVRLLDSTGAVVATRTTDASGGYLFDNLRPGDFMIEVVLPGDYQFSPRDVGNNRSDSDVDITTGRTIIVNLTPGKIDLTWDAGLVPLTSIGDFVWNDANNNSQQDTGEAGMPGITVNLLNAGGTVIRTTTTDAGGKYLFANLPPATYAIEVIRPVGYVFSPRDVGSDASDSDVNRTTGRTINTTLTPGKNDLTWDAGLVLDASIGNYVWSDQNDNGIQDAGEPGVVGITVRLLDSSGNVVSTTTTDGSGFYLFDFLTPADYSLEFVAPAGYAMARRDQGGDDGLDSDPDRFTGRTITTTLSPGEDDLTWDAGLVLSASIGDFVWRDNNNNGQQDAGEPGVAGVTVNLLNSSGAVIKTTTTNASGLYLFADLPTDDYEIQVVLPSGFVFSQQNQGNDASDSDVSITTGRAGLTTLSPDEDDMTWDAGLVPVASIGDRVWRDNNNNGIQDNGEPGVSGVTVNLLNSGTVVATTTTNASGAYIFNNLRPGDYAVEFVLPAGYQRSLQDQGADDAVDSDASVTTGRTIVTTLDPGENDLTWDAGLVPLSAIGNFVWSDNNNNGIQDSGELGVNNVTVNLYNSSNTIIATTTTNSSGLYSFANLAPGSYSLGFVLPSGYQFSAIDQGANDAVDSDANITTGRTVATTLAPGVTDNNWDAGLVPLASIGDFVWQDTNGNGQQNAIATEPGVAGVTVNLLNSSGIVINTTTTNASGNYLFSNLPPATYAIEFVLPTGYIFTTRDSGSDNTDSDADRTTGRTINVTLAPGQNALTWDAGIVQPSSIGDFVWLDSNDNGVQDAGEPGLSGVTVRLLNSGGTLITSTTTNASGNYLFPNLLPATYIVEVVLPTGYVVARQDQGGNDATDSDANRTTRRTANIVLPANKNDLNWDIGLLQVATIGNFVWIDDNNNGIQDAGEPGISGVTVNLLNTAGTTVATTTTNASGIYTFTNVTPGDYRIEVVLPTGYVFSTADQGADDAADSDVSITNGRSTLTTLSSNETDLTWDAGLVRVASIGDFVWRDNNNNGIQDSGEPGISGVTVNLLNSSGTVVGTTTTNASGAYSFINLRPGDYAVEFILPAGYQRSLQDQGGDDTKDSDASPTTGRTIVTTLSVGENDLTWDAGFVPLTSIGDRVWIDANDNGIQDTGEVGLAGVTVRLLNSGGTVINTTTTNASGNYVFSNLAPGSYAIEFVTPAGYVIAKRDQGADDAADSDPDQTTGRTVTTTLTPSQVDLTWDMGLVPVASIGNYVWRDTNGNGQQDGSETGVNNVTVNLLNSSGTVINTTTTNASGNYLFANLRPGVYAVQFVLPSGYIFTTQDVGVDTSDSDADRTTGRTINVTLAPGQNDMSWDAGIVQPASIGDFVWLDSNDNGIQDAGENGVNGVTVRLLSSTGTTLSTTTTGTNGNYLFANLIPGIYAVQVVPPTGHVIARLDQGGNDATDSDGNRTTGRTINTDLSEAENDLTWDVGLVQVASIGDRVWIDINNNGIQDAGENNLAGVTVNLLSSSGTVLNTTTTNASGNYLFANLTPADYAIQVVLPSGYQFSQQDAGSDDAQDSDVDITTGRTVTTTLGSGENDLTWDAGVVPLASIGNRVWIDINNNGIQDAGEANAPGVVVNLLNSSGAIINTATTNASGNYLFANLPPATYSIQVVLPAGYQFSVRDQGADDTVDSDVDTTTGRTITTVLDPGENDLTWDAGIVPLASIGNFVWRDNNDNGIQDAGEPGVNNVTVRLLNSSGAVFRTTTTNVSGAYSFTNVPSGDYSLEFVTPAGYVISQRDQGADDALDSDPDLTTGRTIITTLSPGENDLTWDMGLVPVASIGNRVWIDINNNGIQDTGENNLAGVTVNLLDGGGVLLATDTTDGSGIYGFENLRPSTYAVQVVLPAGYQFSAQDQGGDDAADSDVDITTGRTINTTLSPDENDLTWDAGVVPLTSIGDRVWRDNNNNGVQDTGEPGVPGVSVRLLDSTGALITATVTDTNGNYIFASLPPGTYSVQVVLPTGYQFSPRDQGGDDAADSDVDFTTGRTVNTTLSPDENDTTWDAGLVPLASIGDRVWRDNNDNGVQDTGEPGMPGVTVNLLDSTGAVFRTTTTNASGNYLFENVPPGDYSLEFVTPAGYVISQRDQGADDALDSDPDLTTGRTIITTLSPGENDLTWDLGFVPVASIGNRVWIDINNNGIQDTGENNLAGVTVNLLDATGTVLATDTTDAAGIYGFGDLRPGTYAIQVILPAGYQFSAQDQGGDDAQDSDVDVTTGRTVNTVLAPDENDLTWDVGVVPLASIGDRVWIDINNNGVQDTGEANAPGVVVNLLNSSGSIIATTTTDGSGNYLFNNLPPATYAIQVVLPAGYQFSARDQGSDDAADSDVDTTTGRTITTLLDPDEDDMTWDAGIVPLTSIGNFVWRDNNDNGVQDSGEPGVAGVTVNLLNSSGTVIRTTTTDASGNYTFTNLPPGDYSLEFVTPAGYVISQRDQGGDDTADSDADLTTGRTIRTTLDPDEDDMTWDLGLVPVASIGDRVWIDINNNGIQDSGENNLAGVTVNLLNSSGTVIATDTTDASGIYGFGDLRPGTYAIQVVLPTGYQFSQRDQGGDDAEDSDVDFTTGRTVNIVLAPDENDLTWDAGVVPLTSIGDRVWRDDNNDGIQDSGESGVSGVTVRLLNSTGAVIATTTTNSTGAYSFLGLQPGDYAIQVTLPAGYQFSPQNTGADGAVDSDVDFTTGRTVTTPLIPDENDLTWDAGLVPLVSIGNFVWRDNDGDGIQDSGEPGVSDVTVRLLNSSGTVIATTTTNSSGAYSFTNLPPGDYAIQVVLPPVYQFSPQDAGADDAVDSDVNITIGRSVNTTLIPGENDLTWDAGLIPLGSIGDTIWIDLNGNGVIDAGENPLPNVTVNLLNSSGTIIATTTTDANGFYHFNDLPAGTYTVQVDETTLPPLFGRASDPDSVKDGQNTYTLGIGENVNTRDFGYWPLGSIGNTVWLDTNRNGFLDTRETGIPNVTVTLEWSDGTIQTAVTDANGKFLFENLPPGDYIVKVDITTLPRGLELTGDPDAVFDSETQITLGPGENNLTLEFGYAEPEPVFPAGAGTPTPLPEATEAPGIDGTTGTDWNSVMACQRSCVDWQLYHTNETGDWEIFRLGNLGDRPAVSPNLSQGEGADDISPTRSPNAEWIVFSSNRDGNWELYVAPTDGDSSKTQRITHNTVAVDTDPVWGPNNFVVFETTRDGNWELYLMDMITGTQTRLTDNEADDINAFWSPDGTKILFQNDRSGMWQIYEIDLRSGSITRLSDGMANDVDAQYNNAGDLIAFRSYRDGENSVIYQMNANGTNPQRISDAAGDATSPAWSPDDTLLSYQSDLDGDLDIYVYDVGTGETRQVTDNDLPDYAPTWLCDTSQLIFTSEVSGNPDLFQQDALPIDAPAVDVQEDSAQLTFEESADVYPENSPTEEDASREGHLPGPVGTLGEQTSFLQPDVSVTEADPSIDTGEIWQSVNSCEVVCPAWSLYNTNRTGDWEIFRLDDGSTDADSLNLSGGVGANDREPTRSPNAQFVAFTSDRDGNDEIYIASADGSRQQRATFNPGVDTDPAWSPDSQHLVYESNRDGNWNLFMLDVQTGVETRLTDDSADERNPSWSSAGGSIAFESNRDGLWQIYVYSLADGSVTRLPTDAEATNPVFGNGGGMIAFNLAGENGKSQIAIMLPDGSGIEVISDPEGDAHNPSWYFDDTLLAYQSDLDGDLDVYVYHFTTEETRKLTDNSVADYAPTWQCGDPNVTFTSEVTGNADIFRTPALPIEDDPIMVDEDAEQLTQDEASDRYPVGAPTEENASREDK